jgi:hypothetical protein
MCDSKDLAYRFIWDKSIVESYALEIVKILGIIIGKALFERISLNCYLDRTILRQICNQNVFLNDVASYDSKVRVN